ncbi:MAG: hypothetical protein QM811_13875 [Pirellulales bacterium]
MSWPLAACTAISAHGAAWEWDGDLRLPLAVRGCEIPDAELYRERFAEFGITPLDYRVRLVFPTEFNRLVVERGNKSTLLSEVTLDLVVAVLQKFPGEAAVIDADKHGGRDTYAGVLQHVRPDGWIEIHHESRAESRYTWLLDGLRHRIAFRARAASRRR